MKFLVDNALSPLGQMVYDKQGTMQSMYRDYDMQSATDEEIFDRASDEQQVIISADTDFGTILAIRRSRHPSVILLRRLSQRRPELQEKVLTDNLPALLDVLEQGCVAVIEESRIRIRMLPIGGTH